MELSGTARVILGFLRHEPMSGYDIKQLADKSTRFFWAASYGQIYPELRRLTGRGLVEPIGEEQEGRGRKVFALTDEGRRVADDWLESPEITYELRDEAMLKHFLGDFSSEEATLRTLEAKRRYHLDRIEELEGIRPLAESYDLRFPLRSLRFGLEFHRWIAEWCKREIAELGADGNGPAPQRPSDGGGEDQRGSGR